ncbi:MAG: MoaD/ThiS family protein [Armatimonadota bacterium]|nr:MoaD/ThiS family protein [Armatimonadota bacterium]
MKVTVKLIGGFVYAAGFSEKTFELAPGSTVETVLESLGLDASIPKIVARNGAVVATEEALEEGDRVVISPIYSGG